MSKKPFKETKVGKFLSGEGASNLLNTIGQVATGNWIGAAGSISDMIQGSTELTPEKKELALQYLAQDLEAMKLEIEDRKDARSREVLINQAEGSSWLSKNTGSIIALTFTLFTCILFILVLTGNIKPSENITFTIVSSVTNIFMLVCGYYFGSSRSSQAKDGTIARLTQ
jgi:hypothetical protein